MRSLVVKNLETRVPHNTWLPLNNAKDTRQKPLSHVESWHVLTLLYTHLSYPHMDIPHFWRIPFSLAGTCDSKLPPHDEHGLDEPSGRGRARGTCRAHRFPGRWAMAMGVKFAAILNHHRIPAVLFLGSMQNHAKKNSHSCRSCFPNQPRLNEKSFQRQTLHQFATMLLAVFCNKSFKLSQHWEVWCPPLWLLWSAGCLFCAWQLHFPQSSPFFAFPLPSLPSLPSLPFPFPPLPAGKWTKREVFS